jgi:alkylation response protein AidB-like acyl-CoA dehydrogenase
MDFDETPEEMAFRDEVRSWLRRNAKEKDPGQLSTSHSFYDFDDVFVTEGKAWQRRLFDGGWAGITWPVEFGGRGGDFVQSMIFRQEESRFDVTSGLFAVAIGMAGPTLIGHGTDAQRARYLPAMLRGDEIWCQLFSEPGAGSDLAALATRADPDGDEWVVNGQKVWSSGAHHADLGILLARTDPDLPKHRGITFFVLDMHTPGVEVRPLRQMTGGATFNEVFLTDVRVPMANVVGDVNGGWQATMTTLANERNLSGGTSNFPQVLALARRCGSTSDPMIRQRLADCFAKGQIIRYLGFRIQTALSRGMSTPETSVLKLFYSQMAKEMAELTLAVQGPRGALLGEDAPEAGYWQQQFLSSPSLRIAAGSDEVQRNIIGERVLGLPRDIRVDKDVPFRDLIR